MFRNSIVLLFILLNLSGLSVIGQVDSLTVKKVSIINAEHKVDGIYKTFDNFRRNQPFYTDSFKVIGADQGSNDKVFFNQYRDELVFTNEKGKEKQQGTQRFFGYCLNDTVYIAFWKFHRIVEFGHLSLIKVRELRPDNYYNNPFPMSGMQFHQMHQPPPQPPRMNFPSRFGPNASAYDDFEEPPFDRWVDLWYILDFMTGDLESINTIFMLDKFELWDKELYKEYKKTKNKRDLQIQLEFVRRFNERNPIRF